MTKTKLLEIVKLKFKSMAGLGRALGVEKSCISKYFAGERSPGVPVMRHMAKILDLDFMEIVETFYGSDDRA